MYFPKPSLNENDMAIIERGDTAAHSIEAGQYVSWHGKTGKAKAAILQGATLDDTLFDYSENGAINELNASLTQVESLAKGGTVSMTRTGHVVNIVCNDLGTVSYYPEDVRNNVYTLPEIYRPKQKVFAPGKLRGDESFVTMYSIDTAGVISFYGYRICDMGDLNVTYIV